MEVAERIGHDLIKFTREMFVFEVRLDRFPNLTEIEVGYICGAG